MNETELYIFAGGGTGGHLYPAMAIASYLRERNPNAKIVFACSDRAIDRRVLNPTGYAIVEQPIRPLPRSLKSVPGFLRTYFASMRQAKQMIADLQPQAVLGLGGFAAAPLVESGWRNGTFTALLNPDAVPGIANRRLAKKANVIFTQFPATARHLPAKLRSRIECAGCPVRRELLSGDREEAIEHFGLDPHRKTLFVNGGSLGAAAVNQAVDRIVEENPSEAMKDEWQILHVRGPEKQRPNQNRETLRVVQLDYCTRMDLAYAVADLTICRGGASTIAEISATGTSAIVVPYPHHKDRQQFLNAQRLIEVGAAVLCEQTKDSDTFTQRLADALVQIVKNPQRLAEMRRNAEESSPKDASAHIAQVLLKKNPRLER